MNSSKDIKRELLITFQSELSGSCPPIGELTVI